MKYTVTGCAPGPGGVLRTAAAPKGVFVSFFSVERQQQQDARREKGEKEESGVGHEKNQNIVGRFLSSGDHLPLLLRPHMATLCFGSRTNQF